MKIIMKSKANTSCFMHNLFCPLCKFWQEMLLLDDWLATIFSRKTRFVQGIGMNHETD